MPKPASSRKPPDGDAAEQAPPPSASPRWRVPALARFLTRGDRGRLGESLALRYLRRARFRILGRNVRMQAGELDLIVRRGEVLAFVEVRTRQPNAPLSPEASIDATKQSHIVRAAEEWLMRQRRLKRFYIRFDIIAIELDDEHRVHRFAHYERAFEPPRSSAGRR